MNLCPILWEHLAPGGTIVAVVGQNRGNAYIHEAQQTIGGEIGWAGDDACRFEYWVARKAPAPSGGASVTRMRDWE